MEQKLVGGRIAVTPEAGLADVTSRNGVEVGRIGGYLATWEPDTGGKYGVPDAFVRGAFARSIAEHKERGGRAIRLNYMHDRLIGGFPISDVSEDSKGLRVVGEVNLGTSLGSDVFALAQQGVLTDLSIGFIATRDKIEAGVRKIYEAVIVEGSLVSEPANRGATVTALKARDPLEKSWRTSALRRSRSADRPDRRRPRPERRCHLASRRTIRSARCCVISPRRAMRSGVSEEESESWIKRPTTPASRICCGR